MITYSFNDIGSALAKPYQSLENAYRNYRLAYRALNLPGGREFERAFRSHLVTQHLARILYLNNDYAIRNCVQCAQHHFHSSLYNIPWIRQCPIHTDERLLDKCPECGLGWFFHSKFLRARECPLCGISGRVTLPKQSEIDLIEQALAPLVASVLAAYPEWLQYAPQVALKVVDISAESAMQMLFFGGASTIFENRHTRHWKGMAFHQLPTDLQPSVLSQCLPEYAKSIQLLSKIFPYSKRTAALISRGLRTPEQIWGMHQDSCISHDVRPIWFDDSINAVMNNVEHFLMQERLCQCRKKNMNSCAICKRLEAWKEKIKLSLPDKYCLPRQGFGSDRSTPASDLFLYNNSYLPPTRIILRLSELEFDYYEVPDEFRKIAFSIKLYSSFCDNVLYALDAPPLLEKGSTATAEPINNELLKEYPLRYSYQIHSLEKNIDLSFLFRNTNSLFYFLDENAQFHMLYPEIIDTMIHKADH